MEYSREHLLKLILILQYGKKATSATKWRLLSHQKNARLMRCSHEHVRSTLGEHHQKVETYSGSSKA